MLSACSLWHAVETQIKAVERKEERLEAALEGTGLTYLGTADHVRVLKISTSYGTRAWGATCVLSWA